MRRAATLLEVMVANTILIIALAAAAMSLTLGMRQIAERRTRATAELVAESHMEFLIATERARGLVDSDCGAVNYNRSVLGDGAGVFQASCSLEDGRPGPGHRRLTVDVSTTFDGRAISTSFSTYVPAALVFP